MKGDMDMGLFSKKVLVCEKCGKQFEARLKSSLCDECRKKADDIYPEIRSYIDFSYNVSNRIPESKYEEVLEHRNRILEKYRNNNGITIDELKIASANYKNLSDQQARDVITRARNSEVNSTLGGLYTTKFIMPTLFEKTIVSMDDVFAVAYTSDSSFYSMNGEAISVDFFTNDPYMSAFSMVFTGESDKGFFKTKSSSGRAAITYLFGSLCPNLKYPIQELKDFQKQLKSDKCVKGNIDYKIMMDLVDRASIYMTPFESKKLPNYPSDEEIELINKYGYITHEKVNEILRMDKRKNFDYWYDKDPTNHDELDDL